jgi:hypothetical protein
LSIFHEVDGKKVPNTTNIITYKFLLEFRVLDFKVL